MALKTHSGLTAEPPVIVIYGDSGIGKSSFGAGAPNPVFIFTENGLGNLTIPRLTFGDADPIREVAQTYDEVMESLYGLLTETHDYKSLVLDTVDWFEPMVWAELIKRMPSTENGRKVLNIDDYGYGRGYKLAIDFWTDFTTLINRLRRERDMAIIMIGHYTKEKVSPPDGVSYDSYNLKLQNSDKTSARDKIIESSDIVLFANWRMTTTDEKMGFGNTRVRGVGNGDRMVYTEKRPAYEAKNRYGLSQSIHVRDSDTQWAAVWDELVAKVPWFQKFAQPELNDAQSSQTQEN